MNKFKLFKLTLISLLILSSIMSITFLLVSVITNTFNPYGIISIIFGGLLLLMLCFSSVGCINDGCILCITEEQYRQAMDQPESLTGGGL